MISLRKLTRRYDTFDGSSIEPVSDVSLDIAPAEFLIIIGRSGSGKTTLLNLIAGLIKPTEGSVVVDGTDIRNMKDKQLSLLRGKKIGFVFQFPSLLPTLNVIDNVSFPRVFISSDNQDSAIARASKLLEMVGLQDKSGCYPRELSAGEQKRAVIARALINEPEIVLADEPTSDLDEKTEEEIMNLFKQIRETGVTVLMVTHNLDLIPYASRAFKMEKGHLIAISNRSSPVHQDVFD
jgi:ABC-type lipoprotein export system ATPase subunit